jgi:hypothetical protein
MELHWCRRTRRCPRRIPARRPLELAWVRQLLPATTNIIRDAEIERNQRGALETVLRGNRRCGLRRRISVGVEALSVPTSVGFASLPRAGVLPAASPSCVGPPPPHLLHVPAISKSTRPLLLGTSAVAAPVPISMSSLISSHPLLQCCAATRSSHLRVFCCHNAVTSPLLPFRASGRQPRPRLDTGRGSKNRPPRRTLARSSKIAAKNMEISITAVSRSGKIRYFWEYEMVSASLLLSRLPGFLFPGC